jgi:hypothetical protein
MVPVRAEIIKESYGKVMNSFAVLLAAGDRKEEALIFANYAYSYDCVNIIIYILLVPNRSGVRSHRLKDGWNGTPDWK